MSPTLLGGRRHEASRTQAIISTYGVLLTVALFTAAVTPAVANASPPIVQRGGCLIADVRTGPAPSRVPLAFCDKYPAADPRGISLSASSSFLVPRLAAAIDIAEKRLCGAIGCAIKPGTSLRLIYYADHSVQAYTASDAQSVTILISAALVDSMLSTVTSLIDDLASIGGSPVTDGTPLRKWLEEIASFSGKTCPSRFRPPFGHLTAEYVNEVVAVFALAMYTFAMSHELAHIKWGAACETPAGADSPTIELACDRLATNHNDRDEYGAPVGFIIAWMVVLNHLEGLLGDSARNLGPLASLKHDGPPLLTFFPARNWTTRGNALLAEWERICVARKGDPEWCPSRAAKAYMNEILALPRPKPCQ